MSTLFDKSFYENKNHIKENNSLIDLFAGIVGFHQTEHPVGTKCILALKRSRKNIFH